jgi:hypothetical protein
MASTASMVSGCWSAPPVGALVIAEKPSTGRPAWAAAITSTTVDMPIASPPAEAKKRRSAEVSSEGPAMPT